MAPCSTGCKGLGEVLSKAIPSHWGPAMGPLLNDENLPNLCKRQNKDLSGGVCLCLPSDSGKNFVARQLPDKPHSHYRQGCRQYI